MKYQFETETTIRKCMHCPLMLEMRFFHGATFQYFCPFTKKEVNPYARPDTNCPLVEVAE